MEQDDVSVGLLDGSGRSFGTASPAQTFGNIIVSIVGTGVLGLPFAFRVAGWLAGSIGVAIAGISSYYCMLLLIQCRQKLATEELVGGATYGDLGCRCMGKLGRYLTEFLILIAQSGACVAYLVFIAQNLLSLFDGHGPKFSSYIFLLVPIEIGLSWIRSLSSLAPFSIFADICNALSMLIVVKEDIQQALRGEFSFRDRTAITSHIGGLPFAAGMAVFCFEGFTMTLALENSMKEKTKFPALLAFAFTVITILYTLFGFFGYMAYGDETRDIVTLNLHRSWTATAVKIGLCAGLVFTFPIMLHPINEIVEGQLNRIRSCRSTKFASYTDECDGSPGIGKSGVYLSRAIVVAVLAVLATCVPAFGVFASLVGSTVCALISFVLPATFHLKLFGSSMHLWQKALDYVMVSGGLIFATYGTYNTVVGI